MKFKLSNNTHTDVVINKMASIVDDSKHVSNNNNNKKNVLTIDAKEENIMEHDNNNNEHSETKIAVLEAMFLLQTEISCAHSLL